MRDWQDTLVNEGPFPPDLSSRHSLLKPHHSLFHSYSLLICVPRKGWAISNNKRIPMKWWENVHFYSTVQFSTTVTFLLSFDFCNYTVKLVGHTMSRGLVCLFYVFFFIIFDGKQTFKHIQCNIERKCLLWNKTPVHFLLSPKHFNICNVTMFFLRR